MLLHFSPSSWIFIILGLLLSGYLKLASNNAHRTETIRAANASAIITPVIHFR